MSHTFRPREPNGAGKQGIDSLAQFPRVQAHVDLQQMNAEDAGLPDEAIQRGRSTGRCIAHHTEVLNQRLGVAVDPRGVNVDVVIESTHGPCEAVANQAQLATQRFVGVGAAFVITTRQRAGIACDRLEQGSRIGVPGGLGMQSGGSDDAVAHEAKSRTPSLDNGEAHGLTGRRGVAIHVAARPLHK